MVVYGIGGNFFLDEDSPATSLKLPIEGKGSFSPGWATTELADQGLDNWVLPPVSLFHAGSNTIRSSARPVLEGKRCPCLDVRLTSY